MCRASGLTSYVVEARCGAEAPPHEPYCGSFGDSCGLAWGGPVAQIGEGTVE